MSSRIGAGTVFEEKTGDTIMTPVARTEARNHINKNSPFSIYDWRAEGLQVPEKSVPPQPGRT